MTTTLRHAAGLRFLLGLAAAAALARPAAALAAPPLAPGGTGEAYVELVFDGSGSMGEATPEGRKIDIARAALTETLRGFEGRPRLRAALRAYGHQSPKSRKDCRDTRLEVPFGPVDAKALGATLAGLEPKGYTPLEHVIRAAAADLAPKGGAKAMILFTDGLETCGGDPCAAARELAASGRGVTIHVVGFALGGAADEQLACIAEATGGSYLKSERGRDLREAFSKAVTVAAESGRLRFEFMGAGGLEPGLLAYVLDPKTSETVTSVKSGGERALSPGKYRISAEARPQRITTEFTITEGQTTLVRLGGTGSVGFRLLGPDGKEIDTFAYVQDPRSGDTVGTVEKGKTLEVSPGLYDLEVQTQPAPILRKGVRVEAGKRTIETVKAVGRLDLDVRGAEGAKVRTHAYITDLATGDTQGTMNAGRSADLLPGKYRLEIQTIPPIIRESVVVKAGETTHVRVDTIGRLRMDATDAQGRPARVFAYVIDKRTENTLGVLNSGQDLDLVAGTYRLEIQTSPEQIRESIAVRAGQVTRLEVKAR